MKIIVPIILAILMSADLRADQKSPHLLEWGQYLKHHWSNHHQTDGNYIIPHNQAVSTGL